MINLLIDALIALAKLVDRALPDRAAPPVDSPPTVDGDAQPAGAGGHPLASAASAGGHPSWDPAMWTDSKLLTAAAELLWLQSHSGLSQRGRENADSIRRELSHRAAQFRAVEND